jgi:hypothetical protein
MVGYHGVTKGYWLPRSNQGATSGWLPRSNQGVAKVLPRCYQWVTNGWLPRSNQGVAKVQQSNHSHYTELSLNF